MKKKGAIDLSISYVIGFVILFLVIIIGVSIVYKPAAEFIGIAKLIPGFNQTESTEGASILGINLAKDNRLEYYSGEEWKTIDLKIKDFRLGDHEIKPENLKNELVNFYFNTPRDPASLALDFNSWAYWLVEPSNSFDKDAKNYVFKITPHVKKSFVELDKIRYYSGQSIVVDFNGLTYLRKYIDIPTPSPPYLDNLAEIQLNQASSKEFIEKAISWRDSILSGNKCEKFLVVNDKNYVVRKVENYLFVDLAVPVEGRSEKYSVDCFGVENYVDNQIKFKEEVHSVGFVYSEFIQRLLGDSEFSAYLTFNPSLNPSWTYVRGNFPQSYSVLRGDSFYADLVLLAQGSGIFSKHAVSFKNPDHQVAVSGQTTPVNIGYLKNKNWDDLKTEDRNKFIYDVLNAYYSSYKVEGVENA